MRAVNSLILSIVNKINNGTSSKWIPKIVFIVFGLIYFVITICNHYFFRTSCFDYGTYNFAFFDYAHFRISNSPVYYPNEHMSFLQDHVSFTLMIFVPFYWIFSWLTGTYTLLLIQNCFILFGAWAVYKLVELKTNNKLLPLLALVQYLALLGRWTAFIGDCNLAILASSMAPVFLLYFEKKKFLPAFLVLIFILLTREDMALWTAFMGIFLLLTHVKDKTSRIASSSVIILSVLYFIVVFILIIPLLETPEKKFSLFQYSLLGKNPYEALMFVLKHPLKVFTLLFVNTTSDPTYNGIKLDFYIYYFLCGGFLLLYNPKYLLLFIPLIAKKMLNDEPLRWSMEWYYSIEFVSILPIAVFLIISEIKKDKLKNIFVGIICFTTIAATIYEMDCSHRKISWWGDGKYAFYKSKMYRADFNVKRVYKNLKKIPLDAKISASENLVPHLAFRSKIYCFPAVYNAEYLIVLLNSTTYPLYREQFDTEVKKYLFNNKWKVYLNDYPLLILKKSS
jgi:uncharacterized membrane protein